MENAEVYLLDYLQEEFDRTAADGHTVRVRLAKQDKEAGVSVKTESREYFFPLHWAENMQFDQIERLVSRIKDSF